MNELRYRSLSSLKSLISLVLLHFETIFSIWDPVVEVPDVESIPTAKIPHLNRSKFSSSFQLQFLFPFLVFVIYFLDTSIILYMENFSFAHSELFFTNRVYPKEFWTMANTIIPVGSLMAVLVFALLLFGSKLEDKYKVYLVLDPENNTEVKMYYFQKNLLIKLSESESSKIYLTRSRLTSLFKLSYWPTTLLSIGFFEFQMFLRWHGTVKDVIMLLYVPLFVIYILNGKEQLLITGTKNSCNLVCNFS